MDPENPQTFTAFVGGRRLASGSLDEVAVAARRVAASARAPLLVFADASGEQVELDLRGGDEDVRKRYRPPRAAASEAAPRARGRPRLGVVSREVTLLPDQWEWLASQPGGASVALRKLVQEARRNGTARDRMRRSQERAYKVMVALAGDRPGFEEAARALFANDIPAFTQRVEGWPKDVREHLLALANPDHETASRRPE
jgi:hypothetical protein